VGELMYVDSEDDWPALMMALSKGLTSQPLALPQLSDVLEVMEELKRARPGGEGPSPPPPPPVTAHAGSTPAAAPKKKAPLKGARPGGEGPSPPPPPPVTAHAGSTPAAALKKKAPGVWGLRLPLS